MRAAPMLRLARVAALLVATVPGATGCGGAPADAYPGAARPADHAGYFPSRDLGPLFPAVQLGGVFEDSKTFVDARPRTPPADVVRRYRARRDARGFDLDAFVRRNFDVPAPVGVTLPDEPAATMEAHLRALWPVLTRPADSPDPRSSLVPLPNPYVVPGGRFREVYYWDSYFTMLGLVASGRADLVRSMIDNFAHLVRTVGHVPNGNRTYYLSRSQPPFLGAMVGLYAAAVDSAAALRWLDALEAEHAFWMEGADRIAPGEAYRRVARLPDGSVLNRYWDDRPEPRPESYREDYRLAQSVPSAERPALYRHIRAAAESGWDFSSRWMRDPADLGTLETTGIAPIDLNSLLYHTERTIAALRRFRDRTGDAEAADRFDRAAAERRRALLDAAWDPDRRFFYDVRWRTGARVTDRPTLAAAVVLYFGLATSAQGTAIADALALDFLRPGGFVTTRIRSGQQWDAPNGWPPLQWMAVQGLRRYGSTALADTAADRWLRLLRRTWQRTGRMMEKYDVVDLDRPAGGGEYPTQDGFGWTNGVALALLAPVAPTAPAPEPVHEPAREPAGGPAREPAGEPARERTGEPAREPAGGTFTELAPRPRAQRTPSQTRPWSHQIRKSPRIR
ncbi:MAG: alpha,alpha-trehalase TreF [Gemmatimonadota bacterium]